MVAEEREHAMFFVLESAIVSLSGRLWSFRVVLAFGIN